MEIQKSQNPKKNPNPIKKDLLSAGCLPLSLSEMEEVSGGKIASSLLYKSPGLIVGTRPGTNGTKSFCHIDGTDDNDDPIAYV